MSSERLVTDRLASAAHQTGKRLMLSELYGCSGWQASFEDFKRAGAEKERLPREHIISFVVV